MSQDAARVHLGNSLQMDKSVMFGCRGLMHQTAFASDYTGMETSGAEWVVANLPALKLVGIDYTSIATIDHLTGTHVPLLAQVQSRAWQQQQRLFEKWACMDAWTVASRAQPCKHSLTMPATDSPASLSDRSRRKMLLPPRLHSAHRAEAFLMLPGPLCACPPCRLSTHLVCCRTGDHHCGGLGTG